MRSAAIVCLVSVGLVSGCFGPRLESGQFGCDDGFCPSGFFCENEVCVSQVGPPVNDAAPSTDPDASPADAGADAPVGQVLCYGEVPTRVVIGTVYADTTVGGFDNANGCNAGGPEHYYELVLTAADLPADVTFDLLNTSYDVVLRVRQGVCDDQAAEFICQDDDNPEIRTQTFTLPGNYFIIVDSHPFSNGGDYELVVTLN